MTLAVVRWCGTCKGPIERHGERFCSRQCSMKYARTQGLLPDDERSPMDWDGRTLFSVVPEQARTYELKCWQGGHVAGGARLTDRQAHTARIVGACVACGGRLFLEVADDGLVGAGAHYRQLA